MNPKVSVIMPVYNAEKYIEKAIDSILEQTYTNLELIIINDCPSDSTMKIVNNFKDGRIHIINNEQNMGIAYSRNVGLEHSKGKYIALMDDDDISLPNRLEHEVRFLEERSDIDIVGGRCEIIDSNDNFISRTPIPLFNPKYIKAIYLLRNVYMNGTVMLRKSIIDKYHIRYNNNCLGMEDYRFWIECSKVCNMSNIDEIILKYRIHTENESTRITTEKLEERKELYAEFQRYSLDESGFCLSEVQLQVINKVMQERNGKCQNWDEAMRFQTALKEIVHQARLIQCDNYNEIVIMCKKMFAEKLSTVESLWE